MQADRRRRPPFGTRASAIPLCLACVLSRGRVKDPTLAQGILVHGIRHPGDDAFLGRARRDQPLAGVPRLPLRWARDPTERSTARGGPSDVARLLLTQDHES